MKTSELMAKVRRLLGDSTGEQFDDDLIMDAVSASLNAVLPWVSVSGSMQIDGDGTLSSFILPDDYYQLISVYDQDSNFYLPQENMTPAFNSSEKRTAYNSYFEYPAGYVSFTSPVPSGVSYSLYYSARWPIITMSDDLPTPTWLGNALSFYGASYAALQKAAMAGNIRQYNVSVDSGNPIQNPWADVSDKFLARFKYEMSLVPVKIKGIK